MELHLWLAYFVAMLALALSPGPGAVLSMGHGLSYGLRQTTVTIVGLQVGVVIIFLIAGLGVGAVLLASGTAFAAIKVLGAAYLVWLGIQQWRAPVHGAMADVAAQPTANLTAQQRFLRGVLTDVTNPKGIVFMVAVLPQFIQPGRSLAQQLVILLVTTIAVDVVIMHGYAALASALRRWLSSARAQGVQNRLTGGVLILMGAAVAFMGRADA